MQQRPRIASCYDHLGGVVGERLTDRLLALGWLTPEPNPGITPAGWAGLRDLGVDLAPLMSQRRRPVAYCTERPGEARHEHVGAHLGAILFQHFRANGWLTVAGKEVQLTPAGEEVLGRLGVNLEEPW